MRLQKMKTGLLIAFVLCFCYIVNAEENQLTKTKNTLWRVSSGKNSVYLLGSLHLLKSDNYPLDDSIDRAFDDSQILVLEVDLRSASDPQTQQMMLAKGMLPEGDSLDKRISNKTYELARAKTAELGLDIAAFKQFKPWFFTMTLARTKFQTLGFNPQYGLDMHFFSKAIQSGKQALGLETFEQQISMLDSLSEINQDELVCQTIKELDTLEQEMDTILKAWSTGDMKLLEETILKSFKEYPTIYKTLITQRNKGWITKIESFLKQKNNYMVVVGAGHLAGNQGLVELLKKKGYSVEQL